MNTRAFPTTRVAALSALFVLFSSTLIAAPPAFTGEKVSVSGRIHATYLSTDDVVLIVEVDGEYCHLAHLSESGRFNVSLPLGSTATMRFMKPGHLPKEIVVNTATAEAGAEVARSARKLRFDVVLDPERTMAGYHYDGPVATLALVKGKIIASQHRTLISKKYQQPVEF